MNIHKSGGLREKFAAVFLQGKFRQKRRQEKSLSEQVEESIHVLRRQKKRIDMETFTSSPVTEMGLRGLILGWTARTFILFSILYGTLLFLGDALRFVTFGGRSVSAVDLDQKFLLTVAAILAVLVMTAVWNRLTLVVIPVAGIAAGLAYLMTISENPVLYLFESLRMTADVALENLALTGYTAYVTYMYEGVYQFGENPEALVKTGVVVLTGIFALLYGLSIGRRVRLVPTALLLAITMVPVFMFNITVTNTGFCWLLVLICGLICLYMYDCRFDGSADLRKQKKTEKAAARAEKRAEKAACRAAKIDYKNRLSLAYLEVIRDGGKTSTARRERKKVALAEKNRRKTEKKQAKLARKKEKEEQKNQKRIALLARREERKKAAEKRRSLSGRENAVVRAAYAAEKKQARKMILEEKRNQRAAKRAEHIRINKRIAGGGLVGVMAMLLAVVTIWLPYTVIEKNFPIIDVINNKMQIARMYVTAYLMGDDVDLNSLSLYGGVSELNPRNLSFDTPQFTGQRIFTADSGYAAPVYLRSWVGSMYDIASDTWTSADADAVLAYRSRFGSNYSPDTITTNFNGYVYPRSVDVTRFDQYRSLDNYGFRVFQVNLRRTAGSSKLLFLPAVMNTNLQIMEYGSIDPVKLKYSAYYDGIYSSRFFGVEDGYSVSSFHPVMKSDKVADNLEKSIQYFQMALTTAEVIQTLETSQEQGIYILDNGYTITNGEKYITDWPEIVAQFESWATNELDYRWDGDSLVYRFLGMNEAERKALFAADAKERAYRVYAHETYAVPFGSTLISELAHDILKDAGIRQGERETVYVRDEAGQILVHVNEETGATSPVIGEIGADSWFTDLHTGKTISRHNAVMAVINYLRENYVYSLEPKVPTITVTDENGQVEEVANLTYESNLEAFLFEVKEGYCVHFATAAAALLREMGFAVRYDEGYIADGWNKTYAQDAVAKYRTSVRDNDAHAWIEVYYPSMGWIQYETTPTFCEAIYDTEAVQSTNSSSSSDSSYSIPDSVEPEVPEEEIVEEESYIWVGVVILAGAMALILGSVISLILKKREDRASEKRIALIRQTCDRDGWFAGKIDGHATARFVIDHIFAVYRGLGRSPETGELPMEYAVRLQNEFGALSSVSMETVMEIIEREEFGGSLSFAQLSVLGKYLEDICSGIYAGLSWQQKFRMRYLKNLV